MPAATIVHTYPDLLRGYSPWRGFWIRFCRDEVPGAPRSSPSAEGPEACRAIDAIEADLGAISPGRAAAGGGHGRLAEGERAC